MVEFLGQVISPMQGLHNLNYLFIFFDIVHSTNIIHTRVYRSNILKKQNM
jgi:hypothetical protein